MVTKKEHAIEMTGKKKKEEEVDPWALADPPPSGTPWKEMTCCEKMGFLLLLLVKIVLLAGLLYLFICSLDLLSSAFRLLGGKRAGEALAKNEFLSNPIADMMIGVLATVLVQSSSTTTSIVVSMVASGLLTVRPAIFIVMGANIGTSVTNSIVALGQIMDRNEFRRAFGGATVHDMFNWLSVIILLPIEWISGSFGSWKGCGLLCQITSRMVQGLDPKTNKDAKKDLLKVITKPFVEKIIRIDKKQLTAIAEGTAEDGVTLIKHKCDKILPMAYFSNDTNSCEIAYVEQKATCDFLFEEVSNKWSDEVVGACLLLLALLALCVCLALIVKVLHSMLKGKIALVVKKTMNADFPGPLRHLTGYVAILVGAGFTVLLQSSSIFTSAITPLVGVGVLSLERMYPLTLGANIGTTFTAIMAALAAEDLHLPMQVALCHLFFNIFGILIWYPIPFMRAVPIAMARTLGNTTAKYRWFAFVYLAFMFLLFPAAIFGLSFAGWVVMVSVGVPILVILVVILVINRLQATRRDSLPKCLQTWNWLPRPLHSLAPYDYLFTRCCSCCHQHERRSSREEFTTDAVVVNRGYDQDEDELGYATIEQPKLAPPEYNGHHE